MIGGSQVLSYIVRQEKLNLIKISSKNSQFCQLKVSKPINGIILIGGHWKYLVGCLLCKTLYRVFLESNNGEVLGCEIKTLLPVSPIDSALA